MGAKNRKFCCLPPYKILDLLANQFFQNLLLKFAIVKGKFGTMLYDRKYCMQLITKIFNFHLKFTLAIFCNRQRFNIKIKYGIYHSKLFLLRLRKKIQVKYDLQFLQLLFLTVVKNDSLKLHYTELIGKRQQFLFKKKSI